jgi:hypothetical protein
VLSSIVGAGGELRAPEGSGVLDLRAHLEPPRLISSSESEALEKAEHNAQIIDTLISRLEPTRHPVHQRRHAVPASAKRGEPDRERRVRQENDARHQRLPRRTAGRRGANPARNGGNERTGKGRKF